ncbi:restriction endonuclease subunit S [Synechococcus sp. BA-124 BA4]|nr:restriction endonuclease subunit S [Synechococcus sp. BA-124 BA4]
MTAMETAIQEEALQRYRPYPAYKDSGVEWLGEIPEHWEVKRLRSTVKSCQNGVWGDEADGLQDIACIRVADFDRVSFRVNIDDPTLRSIEPRVASARGLKQGNLLLEKSGGENQPVGAVVLYDHSIPAVCSNFVARVVLAKSFNSRFMAYLHAALYSLRVNTKHIKQSTGIQNLDSTSYLDEAVVLPSETDEQRSITSFLDRETAQIDVLVAKKQRLIELLLEQRTALITRAVTKGQDPSVPMKASGVEWLGEIPEHWDLVPSTWLFTECKKRALDGDEQLSATQKYGVIPQAEYERLEGRQVVHAFMHLDKRKHVEVDDFVMSMRSFEGGLERVRARGCVRSSYIVLRGTAEVHIGFFSYLLKSSAYIQALKATSNFIRDGQDLNFENFRLVRLPSLPISEQEVTANFLDRKTAEADSLIARVRDAITRLKELRTALISAAVTGKIDVREEVL